MSRITAIVAATVSLALPAAANAHAILEESTPSRGVALERAPDAVTFRFNEPVEAEFGSVRVYDREGEQVDDGELTRPGGKPEAIGVGLAPALADGIYTATYRVISADSHPVSGGFTFTVGDPAGRPEVGVSELLEDASPGSVLEVALATARFVMYVATALLLGGLVFLLWVWVPAVGSIGRPDPRWDLASAAFARRLRRAFAISLFAAAVASVAGIVLQGAIATGGDLGDGLRPSVIDAVLGTDFGTAWGLRLVAIGALATLLPFLSRSRIAVAGIGLAAGYLALAPGIAGHPGATGALSLGASFVHVLSFAVWAGGLALLAFALPVATRALDGGEKTSLLAATVGRFSGLALVSVIALLATGVVQSVLQLEALDDLLDTGYGRAILVKAAVLVALIAIGAFNRARLRPELERLAGGGATPGRPGLLLGRTLRSEALLMGGVLAATAVLTALSPSSPASGPFATGASIGPAQLEVTVDPANAGRNQIHIYLFDAETGAQYREVRELRVDASLPSERVGPIAQRVHSSGPGHYVIRGAELGIRGEWELDFDARVSAFTQYAATVEVPIR